MRTLVICLTLLPASAIADRFCEAVWFSRNAIHDAAGQCFASPLGRALFDNSDCTGNTPVLPEADAARVEALKSWMRPGCAIDTGATTLDLFDIQTRRQLTHQPLPDDTESACIDWLGDPLDLHAGPEAGADVIGHVQTGDTILFSWQHEDGWDYVETGRTGALGWLRSGDVDYENCGKLAG